MTVALDHSNPETTAIGTPLVAGLPDVDVVRLSPPGFGATVPPGWISRRHHGQFSAPDLSPVPRRRCAPS